MGAGRRSHRRRCPCRPRRPTRQLCLIGAVERMAEYIASIDQGTTSTRCMIFDKPGSVVAIDQKEHEQIFPRAGWVEHDAVEIWNNTRDVIGGALAKANLNSSNIKAVGITNQRETTLVWDRATGQPVYNAIVWQ